MADSIQANLVLERFDYMLLPSHLVKGLGTPFLGDNLIRHGFTLLNSHAETEFFLQNSVSSPHA